MKTAALFLIAAAALVQAQEVGHTTAPKVIHKVDPAYTDGALAAGLEGTVVLGFTILPNGIPDDIHVVRSLGKGLDEKAIECLEQWRFQPGTRFGEPVAVKASVEISFRLPPAK